MAGYGDFLNVIDVASYLNRKDVRKVLSDGNEQNINHLAADFVSCCKMSGLQDYTPENCSRIFNSAYKRAAGLVTAHMDAESKQKFEAGFTKFVSSVKTIVKGRYNIALSLAILAIVGIKASGAAENRSRNTSNNV